MNRYEPDVPKAAFACVAAALTAITFGAFVVAPAKLDARLEPATTFAATRPPIEVAISPARIEVVAVRAPGAPSTPNVAWALPDGDRRNCNAVM